jgi:hypothetical protein
MPTLTSNQLDELRRAYVFDEVDAQAGTYRSIFNKRYQAEFFEDSDLQDMTDRAVVRWPQTDTEETEYADNERLLFRAIQIMAFEQYLGADAYLGALGDQSKAVREGWQTKIKNNLVYLSPSFSNVTIQR